MNEPKKIAVIISNMGGPDSLDAVEPYLYNIFKDRDIIDIPLPEFLRDPLVRWLAKKRAPESREIYEKLGGKTPLTEITSQQARHLQDMLNKSAEVDFEVFPAMRYWYPLLEEVWKQVADQSFDKIVVVSLYPFYSTATSGSLEKLIRRLLQTHPVAEGDLRIINRCGNHPLFISAIGNTIKSVIAANPQIEFRDILFSAHSIPMARIRRGDPYRDEVEEAVRLIQRQLPAELRVHLAYQSKLGPVKWLSPATSDKIDQLAGQGVRNLLVYPLGFVADNSETLYEIGMLYRELAESKGISNYYRIDALNTDERFIQLLKELTLQSLGLDLAD